MKSMLKQFWTRDESGQGLVEYALIISLVALAVILAVTAFGTKLTGVFTSITGSF